MNRPRVVRRESQLNALLPAIAFIAGTGVTLLALGTSTRWIQGRDDDIERAVGPYRPALHVVASIITQPGEWYVHPVIAGAIAGVILRARGGPPARILYPLAAASLGATAAHHAIKLVHRRKRPQVALLRRKTESAYPSGHTTNATAVLVTSGYLLAREGLVAGPVSAAVVGAVSLGTGLSRVALGWHWGSDVLGGWLAGIGVAAMSANLYEALVAR